MLAVKAILCVFSVCLLQHAFASDDPTTSLEGVVDLTPDNFDKLVNGAKHAIVEFYAPWCGHCKRMVPEYKKLGETVKKDASLSTRVIIGKVNADNHKELATRFGVSGFPTIKYFPRGVPLKADSYNDARTADKFLAFLKEKLEQDKGFGRIEELDGDVKRFLAAGADRSAVLEDAKSVVDKLDADLKATGDLYIKYMKKAIEKDNGYFMQEAGRLERMVASGSVKASKVEELSKKIAVLSHFEEEEDEDDEVEAEEA